MDNDLKGIMFLLMTFGVLALWIIPAYMMLHGLDGRCGLLYIPIALLTAFWFIILGEIFGSGSNKK